MVDLPGRTYDRAGPDDDEGWGSPVPAEYGSLRAVLPPADEVHAAATNGAAPEASPEPSAVVTLLRRLQGEGAAAVVAPATSLLRRLQGDGPGAVVAPPETEPDTDRSLSPNGLVEPSAPVVAPVVGPVTVPDDVSLVSDLEAASTRARRRPVRRTVSPRSRATVRHIDVLTVLRVSVIFWLVMLTAVVVASVLLWVFADAFGSLPSIEKSIRTLFSLKSFKLHPGQVAFYTFLGGLVVSIVGICANVLFAVIYNLIADVVGGFRVELDHTSRG